MDEAAKEAAMPEAHEGWIAASKYHQTKGGFIVCAIRLNEVWHFEAWDVSARPHKRLGMWRTAAEAREACRDLR